MPNSPDIYRDAVEAWGFGPQVDMMIEECGELIVALSHWKRGRAHNIPEELADVEIMLDQMRYIFGEGAVDKQKARKLLRLRSRIEHGDGGHADAK